jgi:hypothetical protein
MQKSPPLWPPRGITIRHSELPVVVPLARLMTA